MKRVSAYIDGSENDRAALTMAVRFCERVGAELKVVHPLGSAATPKSGSSGHYVLAEGAPPDVVMEVRAATETAAGIAWRAYEQVCGGVDFAQWLESGHSMAEAIRQHGMLSDMNIVERVSEEEGPHVAALNAALFETGAPVLVTPPTAPETIGEAVVVVWSATAQSARALRSAIPILQRARTVWVLTNVANPQAPGLAAYLRSYDIAVEARTFSSAKQTARGRGRAMLAAVKELPADLVVMGAYGENRLNAIFGLGRTTQKVVTGCPIPLFVQR